jgi:glycosyltransferase involved in cell wall biosynthesis
VVENLLTAPFNLAASRAVAAALAGRPALLHHHDPPWHRADLAHVTELPADDPAWRHVAVNAILRDELAALGIEATVIHNAFGDPGPVDPAARATLRAEVRAAVGIDAGDLVVAHPVRAIERKNVPAALALAEGLGATYWLLGPAEEGYAGTLERLLTSARCPVVHAPWTGSIATGPAAAGIHAAADHIAFPSTWEGFGNPPIEAALHRRPATVGHYPVAGRLRALGFRWFNPGDVAGPAALLAEPDGPATVELLDHNHRIARDNFGLGRMAERLTAVLDAAGWLP